MSGIVLEKGKAEKGLLAAMIKRGAACRADLMYSDTLGGLVMDSSLCRVYL